MTIAVDQPDALLVDAAPPDSLRIATVADNVIGLIRTFNRARARMLAAAAHDVEWSGHMVMKCLQNEGDLRATELAECLQSDPSTVSRQVAALVKNGLLERKADPADGRASLLVLTGRARQVLAEHDRIRIDFFAHLLEDWSDEELTQFAGMVRRFTDDFSTSHDTEWEQRLSSAASSGGSN